MAAQANHSLVCTIPHPRTPRRLVLVGVPRIGYSSAGSGACTNRCPENLPFPACLRSILDYQGEDLGYRYLSAHGTTWRLDLTYTYLMAVTGCAFSLSWKPGWFGESEDFDTMPDYLAALYRRAFSAVGYGSPAGISAQNSSEEDLREAIIKSLQEQGRPVIAFGVIGPPEACLITGYDEDGAVLVGWNYFQDDPRYNTGVTFEPSGEFRKAGWFHGTSSLLILGQRRPVPPRAIICRGALRLAVRGMRGLSAGGDGYSGIAAFDAWAGYLQMDTTFPAGDLAALRRHFRVHDRLVATVAEGRWYAARFMEMVAGSAPEMQDDLLSAADCFDDEHDLMWQAWGLTGGSGDSDEYALRLADPLPRREIARLVLEARGKEVQAAGFIESALLSA